MKQAHQSPCRRMLLSSRRAAQFVREFAKLGLTRTVGGVLGLALARELTPVVTSIILAGAVPRSGLLGRGGLCRLPLRELGRDGRSTCRDCPCAWWADLLRVWCNKQPDLVLA